MTNIRTLFVCFFSLLSVVAQAQRRSSSRTQRLSRQDSVAVAYTQRLDSLSQQRRQADARASVGSDRVTFNPYFYRMLTQGTMYNDALNRMLSPRWQAGQGDYNSSLLSASDAQLMQVYTLHPELISYTQNQMMQEPRLREEIKSPISSGSSLTEMAVPVDLGSDVSDPIEVKAHRPKLWTIKGNGSLKFQQSHYSDNWYQGGESNYAAQASVTIEANYDNKKRLTWNNRLEFMMHMQTSSDTVHNPRVTNSLLRATSRVGYKAAKNWNYAGEATANTQLFKKFNANSDEYTSAFAGPLYFQLSVGMDFNSKSKNGKFSQSLYLSPVAYNMTFVADSKAHLRSRYGVKSGKAYHNFGPSVKWEFNWTVCKNVKWNSKFYAFTNLDYFRMQWENKIDFVINKYMSSTLFVYPRFDDSSVKFKGKDGYWMFQEWLSVGLNYDF